MTPNPGKEPPLKVKQDVYLNACLHHKRIFRQLKEPRECCSLPGGLLRRGLRLRTPFQAARLGWLPGGWVAGLNIQFFLAMQIRLCLLNYGHIKSR